ncbi:hypothetical protein PTR23_03305 [Serratia nevei]|uniref:hypothetical protein n=1 Tax=Serratia TaxID=613 RepID=UPI000B06C3BF|nr:hypothetical protein [Serratia marcescens]BEN39450.1 hypothetical protein SMKC049_12420 [Serratia marcescens]
MNWQGVPFNFFSDNTIDNVFLTLSKLPVISIDTGFSWDNFVSALIGGLIPAGIALYTIANNNNSSELQRKEQIKDLKQARKTQLKISERSFNAQVLSANRQNWINNLRDLTADFTKLCSSHMYYRKLYVAEQEGINWSMGDHKQADIYLSKIVSSGEDVIAALTRVRLMLNPNEITSSAIIKAMMEMITIARKTSTKNMPKELFEAPPEYYSYEKRYLAVVQRCLKTEWKRVKSGM